MILQKALGMQPKIIFIPFLINCLVHKIVKKAHDSFQKPKLTCLNVLFCLTNGTKLKYIQLFIRENQPLSVEQKTLFPDKHLPHYITVHLYS